MTAVEEHPRGTAPASPGEPAADERLYLVASDRSERSPHPPARLRRWFRRLDDWLSGYPDTVPVRILHRAPMVLWRLGLGRIAGDQLLTTTGRTSGLPRRAPLSAHRIQGGLYAWDPYGKRAHWYRNLVADPIVTVQDAHGTWTARAAHLDDHDEAVALYGQIGRAIGRRFHEYLADEGVGDTAEGFAGAVGRLHVVRFDPVSEPGPPPLRADLVWVWPVTVSAIILWWAVRR